ncbi:MAG: zinc ribbon domain-containing protein, partial [Oleispira sp.]
SPIYVLLRAMESDKELSDGLRNFLRDRNQAAEIKSEIERVRSAYDTSLLEVIAQNHSDKQSSANENTQYLKQEISTLTAKLNSLTKVEVDTVSRLSEYDLMVQFFELIAVSGENNRELLLADLRDLNFWYPVKRLMMELLFLLPLILVFYFWNSRSLRTHQPYQVLVSSHLLIVAFIPVIFKVLELVYEIMPKTFLKKMFALLESFNLVAIWHYLMMGLGIALALGLIYVLQQKIFSQEKLMQKRIVKGQCQNCGVNVPSGDKACTACGFKQYKGCGHCHNETYVFAKHCKSCGCAE